MSEQPRRSTRERVRPREDEQLGPRNVFQRINEIAQPSSLEVQAEQLTNDIIQNQNVGNNQIYPGLMMFKYRIRHPQVELDIEVINDRRLQAASEKINQLKTTLNDQTRRQIYDLVFLMFEIKQKTREFFRWSNIVEVDRMGARPIPGRSTGANRAMLKAAQTEYDRIVTEANTKRAQAATELGVLNENLDEAIEHQEPEAIFHPEDGDDGDDEFHRPAGDITFEVHREASKVGLENQEKLMEIFNNNTDYPREPITRYVKTKFDSFIKSYPGYDARSKSQKINDLKRVLDKLESAGSKVNRPHNRKLIGNIVDFVMEQPDDFKDSYISSYIHDCANAYPTGRGDQRLSCVGGIVERFYLVLAQYLSTICPGTNESCPDIYRRLNAVLNKTVYEDNNELKNQFIQEWAAEHLNEDDGKTKEERRESFILFMQDKYKEMYSVNKLEDETINMINELANQYDYAFGSGSFGGAKFRKTNKRKTNKRKTNKRKTNKRKTNKRKTNKRKTIRK
jgi:hypothetical protein